MPELRRLVRYKVRQERLLRLQARLPGRRALLKLYLALKSHAVPTLPPPHTYHEYVTWVRGSHQEAERFWGHYLQGLTAPPRMHLGEHGQALAKGAIRRD